MFELIKNDLKKKNIMIRIHFKDEQQDLTHIDVDRHGIIRSVSLFCSDIVTKIYVGSLVKDIAEGRTVSPGKIDLISRPDYTIWTCRYEVDRVEELKGLPQ